MSAHEPAQQRRNAQQAPHRPPPPPDEPIGGQRSDGASAENEGEWPPCARTRQRQRRRASPDDIHTQGARHPSPRPLSLHPTSPDWSNDMSCKGASVSVETGDDTITTNTK